MLLSASYLKSIDVHLLVVSSVITDSFIGISGPRSAPAAPPPFTNGVKMAPMCQTTVLDERSKRNDGRSTDATIFISKTAILQPLQP